MEKYLSRGIAMVYNQDINLDLDTRQPNIIIGAK